MRERAGRECVTARVEQDPLKFSPLLSCLDCALRCETLSGSPRDEQLSFGAYTPMSQHTPLVSRIFVVVQKQWKSSTNRV